MKNTIKSLLSNKQGLALLEFALFLPLILLMFFGVVEFTRYVIITQKAERSAYVLSNITSQFTPIKFTAVDTEASTKTLDEQVFAQFTRTMDVYNTTADRIAIISSITKTGTGNNNDSIKINWQRTGGGSLTSNEAVSFLNGIKAADINSDNPDGSTAGTSPSFPDSRGQSLHNAMSDMFTGENMIITETFYSYQPFLNSILGGFGAASMPATVMKTVVFTRPRNGDINTLKRPANNTDQISNNDEVTDSCITVQLTPQSNSCTSTVDGEGASCIETFNCKKCSEKQICKKCTTAFNGNANCDVYLSVLQNCTNVITTRSCSSGSSSTTPTTTPASPPPS